MRRIDRFLAAGSVALALAGGILGLPASAGAASSLSVTLSASGVGASAVWDAAGDPVLTVGTPSTSTYAEMTISNPPSAAPGTAPAFTTSSYASGSPHWLIQFADGDSLAGYPSPANLGSSNWMVVPAASGTCATVTHTPQDDTYVNVLAFIQNAGCGGNVTGASIVADGSQAPGTSDTIMGILYDGETLVSGPDVVTVTNPGTQTAMVGQAIATLAIAASSAKGDQIASYQATGLPAGLSLDTATGAITGMPTTPGTYPVTISATDNGGTTGSASFTWKVSPWSPDADLAVQLSCARRLTLGATGTCRLTVVNNGPAEASIVVAAVILPDSLAEVACSSGCSRQGGLITWSQSSLANGASMPETVTVRATGPGPALILAAADAANPDPAPLNNISLAAITIAR
jgi:Putative Ig domain/Domain of unknown function DUF11